MSVFNKVLASIVASVAFVGAVSGCTVSAPAVSVALPEISQLIAETSKLVAENIDAQMLAAKSAPRIVRSISRASVEVLEVENVVIVEATRLPPENLMAQRS